MKKLLVALVASLAVLSTPSHAVPVDLELQLLVDVSGSVDGTEYALQKLGYENAFRSSAVINAITNGSIGSIAVQYIEWSGSTQQSVLVDWAIIDSAASANAFADSIAGVTRAFGGATAIGSALTFGSGLFDNNGFEADRWVIDISGDGANNTGTSSSDGRTTALNAGVDTINGIIIEGETGLFNHYNTQVIGGTGAFLETAANFADFGDAVQRKLAKEIAGVPVPASLALIAIGLVALRTSRQAKS